MATNAQAALQAAATVFAGGIQVSGRPSITSLADQFKIWLDEHEPEEVEHSHKITCSSRRGAFGCNCNPVPYNTQGTPTTTDNPAPQ